MNGRDCINSKPHQTEPRRLTAPLWVVVYLLIQRHTKYEITIERPISITVMDSFAVALYAESIYEIYETSKVSQND